ncbi:hypothetical protein WBG78_15710 [Chryseolinea sp. T2]|uniref:hypothetical protein n=1 Tax=Chryseolinea sp. T2 TaxID=3129255 RepID=UPI003078780F
MTAINNQLNDLLLTDLEAELIDFITQEKDGLNSITPGGIWFANMSYVPETKFLCPAKDETGLHQVIPGWIFALQGLNSNDRILLGFIVNTTIGGEGCKMSNPKLGERFGMTSRQTQDSIRKMEKMGLIFYAQELPRVVKVRLSDTVSVATPDHTEIRMVEDDIRKFVRSLYENSHDTIRKNVHITRNNPKGYYNEKQEEQGEADARPTNKLEPTERFDAMWLAFGEGNPSGASCGKGKKAVAQDKWLSLSEDLQHHVESGLSKYLSSNEFQARPAFVTYLSNQERWYKPGGGTARPERKAGDGSKPAQEKRKQEPVNSSGSRQKSDKEIMNARLDTLRTENPELSEKINGLIYKWKAIALDSGKHVTVNKDNRKYVETSVLISALVGIPDSELITVIEEQIEGLLNR